MTPREALIAALELHPPTGRVPHFELVFFLTMEAFGRVHPLHRNYAQWLQMTEHERDLHRTDMADLFIKTAQRYEHNAIFLHTNPCTEEEDIRMIDLVRERSGDSYFLMLHGDATYEIPPGDKMLEWVSWVYENLDDAKRNADEKANCMLEKAERLSKHGGLDGFALCADYCYNDNPFLSPDMFAEVVSQNCAVACVTSVSMSSNTPTATSCRSLTNSLPRGRTRCIPSTRRVASILPK